MKNNIFLGYEIESGKKIEIPLAHTVITGLTNKSGKTTALMTLLKNSGRKCIIFKTKIGEKALTEGTIIPPFYRDRSDWEFIISIIEATTRQKIIIEKGTIMKLSAGTHSLLEVLRRVQEERSTGNLKGLKEEIYIRLENYLQKVIPQIQYSNFSKTLTIFDGINIMDLEKFTEEVQALIITSVLNEVLNNHKDILTVIPEFWKFAPEGKYETPVKLELTRFIRQGATNGNFLLLDSQDIASTSKEILKQVSNWCVSPDTLIRTNDGYKEIKNIKKGDFVLTHKGRFKKVIKIMKRKYIGKILKFKTYGNFKNLVITEEHPIFCEKLHVHGILNKTNSRTILANGNKKIYKYSKPIKANPLWIKTKDITKNELFLLSKIKKYSIKKSLEFNINSDLMNIIGWYLAEGSSDKNVVSLALSSKEYEHALDILNSAKIFKINGDIRNTTNGNCIRVRLFSKKLIEFLSREFGKGAKNKFIPEWVYGLNTELLKTLLKSYTLGDGHQLKINNMRYVITSISEKLLFGIRDICTIIGYPSSLRIARKQKIEVVNNYKKPSILQTKYMIIYDTSLNRMGNRQNHGRVGIDKNYLYLRVKEIKQRNYDGFVYNLKIEEDNSYQTINGIVHNCLGLQTEINEVKHTLNQLPVPKKSKPHEDEIMTLKVGHFFFACPEFVVKIFAQPIWMDSKTAKEIAMGKKDVKDVKEPFRISEYDIARPEKEKENYSPAIISEVNLTLQKELAELRTDFFNKVMTIDEKVNNIGLKLSEMEQQKPVINEDVIVSKVLQKIPLSSPQTPNINMDSIINQVIARIPKATGAITYEVAPLEKITKDFLQEAKDKIISDISSLSNDSKKTLKYLESRQVGCRTAEIVSKGFFLTSGGGNQDRVNKSIKELIAIGVAKKDAGGTSFGILKNRIKELLIVHNATEQEIEQIYNHILMNLIGGNSNS